MSFLTYECDKLRAEVKSLTWRYSEMCRIAGDAITVLRDAGRHVHATKLEEEIAALSQGRGPT